LPIDDRRRHLWLRRHLWRRQMGRTRPRIVGPSPEQGRIGAATSPMTGMGRSPMGADVFDGIDVPCGRRHSVIAGIYGDVGDRKGRDISGLSKDDRRRHQWPPASSMRRHIWDADITSGIGAASGSDVIYGPLHLAGCAFSTNRSV
jgi:hypothetical protein